MNIRMLLTFNDEIAERRFRECCAEYCVSISYFGKEIEKEMVYEVTTLLRDEAEIMTFCNLFHYMGKMRIEPRTSWLEII